jgi:hypothetical protein
MVLTPSSNATIFLPGRSVAVVFVGSVGTNVKLTDLAEGMCMVYNTHTYNKKITHDRTSKSK